MLFDEHHHLGEHRTTGSFRGHGFFVRLRDDEAVSLREFPHLRFLRVNRKHLTVVVFG
ncbi:MAG: hypothetical protein Q7S84_00445 [bacterium]|nr:hypothetical protein [bacterium]